VRADKRVNIIMIEREFELKPDSYLILSLLFVVLLSEINEGFV
jgi:hypothetical protein